MHASTAALSWQLPLRGMSTWHQSGLRLMSGSDKDDLHASILSAVTRRYTRFPCPSSTGHFQACWIKTRSV